MTFLIYIACNSKPKSDSIANRDYYNEISYNLTKLLEISKLNPLEMNHADYLAVINADICSCNYNIIDEVISELLILKKSKLIIAIDKHDYLHKLFKSNKLKEHVIFINGNSEISRLGFLYPHQVIYKYINSKHEVYEVY
ncbi:MAG: hypothetical protein HOP11_11565 [Saprospiraceae bacterium]|nr:hypothetical protein [Saprospiraceae bacterium]